MNNLDHLPSVKFVVLPESRTVDKKPLITLLRLGTDKRAYFAKGKGTTGMSVGHVYEMKIDEKEEGISYFLGSRSWVGVHEDKEQVLQWQAEQKAIDLVRDADARQRKEGTSTSGLEDALEPLRKAYERLPYPQRVAFEVWVLSVLRRKS